MNKKIKIGALIIGLLLVLGLGALVAYRVVYLGSKEDTPLVTSTEVEEPTNTEAPSSTETPTSQEPVEQDRTLKFDNYVKVEKNEESYVEEESIEDIYGDWGSDEYDIVDANDYAAGYILQDSVNLYVQGYGVNNGNLVSELSDVFIHIKEENNLETTIQQLRLDALSSHELNLYEAYEPIGIELDDENVVVGEGLTDFNDYFEYPYELEDDPTVSPTPCYQILCDTVVDTAFGGAIYLEFYSFLDEKYYAYAYILCERDRILNISITDTVRDNLYSYLLEVTNDCVTLIK